jgi:hypothetical protein
LVENGGWLCYTKKKAKSFNRGDIMDKPRFENPFFKYLMMLILVSMFFFIISKIINDNAQSLSSWNFGVWSSDIITLINLIAAFTTVIFKFRKKLNWSEFLICFPLHLSALYVDFLLIMDRI